MNDEDKHRIAECRDALKELFAQRRLRLDQQLDTLDIDERIDMCGAEIARILDLACAGSLAPEDEILRYPGLSVSRRER